MKNLKLLLVAIVTLSMLCSVAFAEDSLVKFSDETVSYTEGNLEISVLAATDGSVGAACYFSILFDVDKWEYASISGATADTANLADGRLNIYFSLDNPTTVTKDSELCKVTFSPNDEDVTETSFTLADVDGAFYDGAWTNPNYASGTITVKAAGPAENVAEFVKDTVELTVEGETHSFTDVPVYEGTTTATSFKLKAVYGEESNYLKFNGSETIDVSNIKVDGEGTVTFQVAIIGKPAAVTIDKLVIE